MRYRLFREQQLNCDVKTAWNFFSSPYNLEKITPQDMGFKVLTDLSNQAIHVGMVIDYTVSPILGIPLHWKTKITQVDFKRSFTDFQEKGPYKYWNHYHEFFPNEEGVLMKDTVDYELPFGPLGTLAHQLFVKNKLEKIFDYRYQILDKSFANLDV
ncbi:SRPBCC family protein [Sphingobacterium sp. MYb382]|uniref:SRPBCC family protein n=1 Tax=Sphingobacterium sp. MYb382 TaxID=2745278 RepID=UPI00309E024F